MPSPAYEKIDEDFRNFLINLNGKTPSSNMEMDIDVTSTLKRPHPYSEDDSDGNKNPGKMNKNNIKKKASTTPIEGPGKASPLQTPLKRDQIPHGNTQKQSNQDKDQVNTPKNLLVELPTKYGAFT